jgi:hypothetical protein
MSEETAVESARTPSASEENATAPARAQSAGEQIAVAPPKSPSTRAARFTAYHTKLEALKAINTRRDIVERDLFMELANVNLDRLSEFPLLAPERLSLFDIMLRRSADHPAHIHVKNWIENFIVAVNRHAKATINQDQDALPRLELEAAAAEAILIKGLQALTFQAGLAKDNLSDAIIARHGEEAVHRIDTVSETAGFGEQYFKALIDNFAFEVVRAAYKELIGAKRTRLNREGQFLILRFPFDEVLARLAGTDKTIQQTRLQEKFTAITAVPESAKIADSLAAWLQSGEHKALDWIKGRPDVAHLARIAAMDPIAGKLVDILGGGTGASADDQDDTVSEVEFVKDQAAAAACGAAIGLDCLKNDFARALRYFEPRETAAIVSPLGVFAPPQLEAVLEMLYEFLFLHILREKGEAESGKFAIRILRNRRLTPEFLAVLAAAGFNRIRQKQLLEPDPDAEGILLYKTKTLAELDAACQLFNFEDQLSAKLRHAYETAPLKIEFAVILNLQKIAKVTTNLSAKVSEIIALFGVKP